MSKSDHSRPPPELRTIPVDPARVARGTFNHETQRDENEGDIARSYSADVIGTSGKVRALFKWQGQQMVAVSMSGRGGIEQAEAYRVVPKEMFTGPTTTYSEKVSRDGGESARGDPLGFYNAMVVSFKRQPVVLQGPSVIFVAEVRPDANPEPEQMNLFQLLGF